MKNVIYIICISKNEKELDVMNEYLKCPNCKENSLVFSYRSDKQPANEATVSFPCIWCCNDCDFIQDEGSFYRNNNIDATQQNELHELLMQNGVRLGVPFL